VLGRLMRPTSGRGCGTKTPPPQQIGRAGQPGLPAGCWTHARTATALRTLFRPAELAALHAALVEAWCDGPDGPIRENAPAGARILVEVLHAAWEE